MYVEPTLVKPTMRWFFGKRVFEGSRRLSSLGRIILPPLTRDWSASPAYSPSPPARTYSVVATQRHGRGAPGPSCSS
eukprot:9218118-Pyramimonas_sp.AAC.2